MSWTWWMTLLVIGAVLLFLGITPVGGDVRYEAEQLSVFLKVWCFRFQILPKKEKKKKNGSGKNKQEKSASKKESAKEAASKKARVSLSLEDLLGLLQLVCQTLGDLRRKLRVELFHLNILFGGEDPADAALAYGRTWALIGSIDPMLEQLFVIKKRDISPVLDYTKEKTSFSGQIILSLTVGRILGLVLHAGIRFLKLRIVKKEKAV